MYLYISNYIYNFMCIYIYIYVWYVYTAKTDTSGEYPGRFLHRCCVDHDVSACIHITLFSASRGTSVSNDRSNSLRSGNSRVT